MSMHDIDELVGDLDEVRALANQLDAAIANAECSENASDYFANVNEALDDARELVRELEALAKRKGEST